MRIVIALGGNALGDNYIKQQALIKKAAKDLENILKNNEVVITHGNGPQVGMITKALSEDNVDMPLDICTAMSEGYIGFHLQKIIREETNIKKEIVTLLTEVIVDKNDPSFDNPTKPIGKFYTQEEAKKLSKETNDMYLMDANRGYRKVVASPLPIDILNVKSIEILLKNNNIVIAAGGGGIPIIKNSKLKGINAVIDKDYASSLLAQKLHADLFIILTAVSQVMLNFDSAKPIKINKMSTQQANQYIKNNEFKKGSMLPKIEAAISFTKKTGNNTIITNLKNIKNIFAGKDVTIIEKQKRN